jgi:DNA-binding XRE family transcriptional regulator
MKLKGTIAVGEKGLRFDDAYQVTIALDGKLWVLWRVSPTVLQFRPMSKMWYPQRGVSAAWLMKEWRERNDCTQKQAAETLGKSVSLIVKIEQGKRAISDEFLKTLREKSKRSLWIRTGRRGAAKVF